jgi:hypothetical protein
LSRVLVTSSAVATRYRCSACGNLTRFDVTSTRRTRSYHHFTVGGELTVEEEQVLDERVEEVACRWCSASGDRIEVLQADPA